jgi:predicted enzyme related to lactoylglutathione lyase
MPKYTSHKPGTFCWVELMTTDATAAKTFYGSLLGWTFDDQPIGDGMTYTMAKLDGSDVGALFQAGAQLQGIPPHWGAYVAVEDVDLVTKKAVANGGKVVKDAFDVMDVGRMSVLQDPSGAALCLWQAKKHHGVGVKNEPGALCWNELYTSNVDAAGKFYVQTLGWKTENHDMGPMGTYTLFKPASGDAAANNIGGMMPIPPNMKGVPSNWLSYFLVTDVDASTKKATELGGKVLAPPMDIPNIGRFSIVQDPQGAAFALYKNAH